MNQKRQITVVGDKAIIPLTRGLVAQIDADDLDKVVGYNWFAVVQKHGAYCKAASMYHGQYARAA